MVRVRVGVGGQGQALVGLISVVDQVRVSLCAGFRVLLCSCRALGLVGVMSFYQELCTYVSFVPACVHSVNSSLFVVDESRLC